LKETLLSFIASGRVVFPVEIPDMFVHILEKHAAVVSWYWTWIIKANTVEAAYYDHFGTRAF